MRQPRRPLARARARASRRRRSRCSWGPARARQARALERKPARKAALERLQADAVNACLVSPFVEAAAAGRRPALRALAQAWLTYIASVEARGAAGPAPACLGQTRLARSEVGQTLR